MSDEERSLEERVRKLERDVQTLQGLLGAPRTHAAPQPPQPSTPSRETAAPRQDKRTPAEPAVSQILRPVSREKRPLLPEHMRSGEYWLGRIGIGLLLLGLAFLFKYAVDQGWLSPWIRIILGLALGAVLIVLGGRLSPKRPRFSQLLHGGGIAALYITGYAAYQLYELVAHPVALGFMAAVTGLAWVLSVRQRQALLSIIGVIGGFGTPFVLVSDSGTMTGLCLYTCLILIGAAAIYLRRGWRSLISVAAVGSWAVFALAYDLGINAADESLTDLWALQIAVLVGVFTWWLVPVLREVLQVCNPSGWPAPEEQPDSLLNGAEELLTPRAHVHALSVVTPIYGLILSSQLWELDDWIWGFVTLSGALIYALVALRLRPYAALTPLRQTQTVTALALLTLSLALFFSDEVLLVAWATEALLLHFVAERTGARVYRAPAHVISFIVLLWVADRVFGESLSGTPFVNAQAAADLWAILAGLVAAMFISSERARRFYVFFPYAGLAALCIREFSGDSLMLALTAHAIGFQIVAAIANDRVLRQAGNLFFAVPALYLAHRLHLDDFRVWMQATDRTPVFNATALVDLIALVAGVVAARRVTDRDGRRVFLVVIHVLLLFWFMREFAPLTNGQAYVSVAWGVYAIALLVAGLLRNSVGLRVAGLATLFVVVAKLFLVDLAALEAIWRVLLFMGFGGLFLVISYYFRSLWRRPNKPPG